MIDLITRWWTSTTSRIGRRSPDTVDAKAQLEQTIAEALNQHARLKDQATSVIANQKQAEIRLNSKMGELEKLHRNARQALLMAAEAQRDHDDAAVSQYEQAAETIADRLIAVEADVESLRTMVLEATQATDQAKAAVKTNSRLLQEKIAEKAKQLSQLEQAKMQEEMNAAMAQLSETVGDDVPAFAEVEAKIDARYERAMAAAEQDETSAERRVLEIEEATDHVAAQQRVAELRTELGLD